MYQVLMLRAAFHLDEDGKTAEGKGRDAKRSEWEAGCRADAARKKVGELRETLCKDHGSEPICKRKPKSTVALRSGTPLGS